MRVCHHEGGRSAPDPGKAERSDRIARKLRAAQAYGQQRLEETGIDVDDIPRLAKESRSS